ncbi:MAG: cytochrome c biogenesis protein CcdA [Myxococcota bacterium]
MAGSSAPADAQDASLSGSAFARRTASGPVLVVSLDVPKGWHLWAMDPGPGPLPLRLTLSDEFAPVGPWRGPKPLTRYDQGFKRQLDQYPEGRVTFRRPLADPPRPGGTVAVRGQICTEEQCLNQSLALPVAAEEAQVQPSPTQPSLSQPSLSQPLGQPLPSKPEWIDLTVETTPENENAGPPTEGGSAVRRPDSGTPENAPWGEEVQRGGLWSYLALAFVFGLGALATPCVFPAIPLTVSFFSKYRSQSVGRAAGLAAVYATTMVVVFAAAGVLVSVVFGVTGLQQFAANPWFNLFLAVLLGFFALNLMGAFELRLPEWAVAAVNRVQRSVGTRPQAGGWSDVLVVMAAALTATTVFFTCTVGFVGVVLVAAARGQIVWPTLGMLAFASAFALPFFVLALFPAATQHFRAGPWLSATRVTLGFIELAAATKFLSNADLVWRWSLLTREAVLSMWIPLFLVAGLFLLGLVRLGHESASDPSGRVPVVQAMTAVGLFAFSTYLAVGLFQGRAFGGWLDGWLPPTRYPGLSAPRSLVDDPSEARIQGGAAAPAPVFDWFDDLEAGRDAAREEGRLVFVNYTGYTCTNCRYMEEAVFPRPEIAALLREMTLVELHTDGGEPRHEQYRLDQVERFGTAALPFYSVETPDGRVLESFPSSTNEPEVFRAFLSAALKRAP